MATQLISSLRDGPNDRTPTVHYPTGLTRQPAFDPYVTEHPKVADSLSPKLFCLPMHHDLTDEHFTTIEDAIRGSLS